MANRNAKPLFRLLCMFVALTAVYSQAITNIRKSYCTGEKMDIKCDPGYRISISRVYFGLKGDRQCVSGRRNYSDKCCSRTARDDCIVIDGNIQRSVNTLCSGRNTCKPSARGIPARNSRCRPPIFKETDTTDFKSVIYDCIPDVDVIDMCSNTEKKAPSLYISSPNYPTPIRGGPTNCTCIAASSAGVSAYALDVSFPDTDNVCEKELSFSESSERIMSIRCNREWAARRQIYRGESENLTISLVSNNHDSGYAWVLLEPSDRSSEIHLYCGDAMMRYLYGKQMTTTTVMPMTTKTYPVPDTTDMPMTTKTYPVSETTTVPMTTKTYPVSETTEMSSKPPSTTTKYMPTTMKPQTPQPEVKTKSTTEESMKQTTSITPMDTTTVTSKISKDKTESTLSTIRKDMFSTPEPTDLPTPEVDPEPEVEPHPSSYPQPMPEINYTVIAEPEPETNYTIMDIDCPAFQCFAMMSRPFAYFDFFPSEENLTESCGYVDSYKQCMKKDDGQCDDQIKDSLKLIDANIQIFCDDFKEDIIERQACFSVVTEKIKSECNKFISPPEKIDEGFENETEEQQCKRMEEFQKCMNMKVKETCEKDAIDLAKQIIERSFKVHVDIQNLKCVTSKPVQGTPESAGLSVHNVMMTVLWITIIFKVLI